MISIKINDQAVQSMLNSLARRVSDMTPAMRQIGEALAEGTKQRFDTASDWDGTPWAPNTEATILRYLGATKGNFKKDGSLSKKGTKRAGAKKPLTGETRSLRSTIFYRASNSGVVIGSPMEYAATQQFGAMRGAFGRTRRNAPIPWGNIPPRPFLPIRSDGSMPQAAANLVMGILEDYLS
ncbi:MAG: phage morphogenesis protein [Opitutae bacterium]|nr:phage morphogenesis protein [Opitutae bacterium]